VRASVGDDADVVAVPSPDPPAAAPPEVSADAAVDAVVDVDIDVDVDVDVDGLVVVVVVVDAWSATSLATCSPALTIAGVTPAAPRDSTSACPVDPRTNLMNADRADAFAGARPEVGTTR
jgi:hypothetical protein